MFRTAPIQRQNPLPLEPADLCPGQGNLRDSRRSRKVTDTNACGRLEPLWSATGRQRWLPGPTPNRAICVATARKARQPADDRINDLLEESPYLGAAYLSSAVGGSPGPAGGCEPRSFHM